MPTRLPYPNASPALIKRLKMLEDAKENPNHILTYDELVLAEAKVLSNATISQQAKERGSGRYISPDLDITSITAPVVNVMACTKPAWVKVRCYHGNTKWMRIRCRKCEACAHAWRSKVRHIITEGAEYSKVWMWTLTIKEYPKSTGTKELLDIIQKRWHNLLRLANKKGVRFEYIRVVEYQKRGTPHYHIAVKNVVVDGYNQHHTEKIYRKLRSLAKASGFGYKKGKTIDFQAARLGGRGVASYMSKYLQKGENYHDLVREDGRAVRRYCRSRNWTRRRYVPTYRYSRDGYGISRAQESERDLPCSCGEGFLLNPEVQKNRWIRANRIAGRWVAPISLLDKILKEESKKYGNKSSKTLRV